jgi:hypothetical protein
MDGKKKTQQQGNAPSLQMKEISEVISESEMEECHKQEPPNIKEESEDDEFDFDDVMVLPAEGLLIKQNEDEVRLLFFYVKPSMGETLTYKAVTELRIPRKHFLHIAGDIQQTMREYTKNEQEEQDLLMYR